MKNLLILFSCLFTTTAFAQKLTEYKAPNGKTYHIGDTVRLGMGTMPDGNFKYIQVNPPLFAPPSRNSNSMNLRKDFALSYGVIKKIRSQKEFSGSDNVIFTVKTGGLPTFDVWIIEAIAACEVTPCNDASSARTAAVSVADELIKLKKLLDDGALTKEEYDAQKKKLLAQ